MRSLISQIISGLIAAILIPACLPLVPTAPVQSLPPQQVGTIVAGTAAAAQTQTAVLIPPTFTLTPTRTPSRTPTAVTPTVTFFFALPTFTPTITPTSIVPTSASGRGKGPTPTRQVRAQWDCAIIGSSPRNAVPVSPRQKFTIFVSLKNTGTRTWTNNGVDFVYRGGFRHIGTRIQDLPDTIVPGNSITLKIQFEAPKKLGLYRSNWSLQVGNHPFCGLRVAFEVK